MFLGGTGPTVHHKEPSEVSVTNGLVQSKTTFNPNTNQDLVKLFSEFSKNTSNSTTL